LEPFRRSLIISQDFWGNLFKVLEEKLGVLSLLGKGGGSFDGVIGMERIFKL